MVEGRRIQFSYCFSYTKYIARACTIHPSIHFLKTMLASESEKHINLYIVFEEVSLFSGGSQIAPTKDSRLN